jgi:hypothetical protein
MVNRLHISQAKTLEDKKGSVGDKLLIIIFVISIVLPHVSKISYLVNVIEN